MQTETAKATRPQTTSAPTHTLYHGGRHTTRSMFMGHTDCKEHTARYAPVQVKITKTAKGFNPREHFVEFDSETRAFATLTKALAWFTGVYGKHKHVKTEGGYAVRYRSGNSTAAWIQRDIITFKEGEVYAN